MAAGLGRRAGPAPGTDDWHADRPAVVSKGARAIVKEKMSARDKHREELPGQVASLQQMQQRSRELNEGLERRSRGNRSWQEFSWSEQVEKQQEEEMQQLTAELEGLELQVAEVHPKVAMEAQRLKDAAQLAALRSGGGGGGGSWRVEDEKAEAHRARTIKQLERALRIKPKVQAIQPQARVGTNGSWR